MNLKKPKNSNILIGKCSKSIFKIIILMLVCILFMSYCGTEKIEEEITIALGYIPNVQFLPLYIAAEKGFFEEVGFKKVNLVYGTSSDVIGLVADGEIDFALADGDGIIIAREKGLTVQNLFTFYKKNPICIVSKKEKGIDTVSKLKGYTLGTTYLAGSSYTVTKSILKKAGLTEEDVNLTSIGYTQVESLIADKVDAAVCFINNEPVVLKNMGIDINVIPTYNMTKLVSASVLSSEKDKKENPEKLNALISVLTKSMTYIIDKPSEAYKIFTEKIITDLDEKQKLIQYEVLKESIKLWGNKDTLGIVSLDVWKESIEELIDLGFIKKSIDYLSINFKN